MSVYPPSYIQQIGPTTPIASLIPNTIIIVNADDTHGGGGTNQSLADANDYCTRRGIPTAGTYNAGNISPAVRQVHFGTVENECVLAGLQNSSSNGYTIGTQKISTAATYGSTASGSSLLQLCYAEITSNGCLCVLFSTYTPTRFLTTDGLAIFAVQAVAAAAYTTLSLGSITRSGIAGPGLTYATTQAALATNIIPSSWASLTNLRPHGRLGCPDLTQAGSTFAELPLAAGGSSVYTNAVTNALTLELKTNYALPVHYSSTEENSFCVDSATVYAAYIAAQRFSVAIDMKSQSLSTDRAYKFLYTNPMSPQQRLWCALWLEGLNVDTTGRGL